MKKLILIFGLTLLVSMSLCVVNGLFAYNNTESVRTEGEENCYDYWWHNNRGVHILRFTNNCDRRLRVEYSVQLEGETEWRHYVGTVLNDGKVVELFSSSTKIVDYRVKVR